MPRTFQDFCSENLAQFGMSIAPSEQWTTTVDDVTWTIIRGRPAFEEAGVPQPVAEIRDIPDYDTVRAVLMKILRPSRWYRHQRRDR